MTLADRLAALYPDEQRVVLAIVERVVARLELGQVQYGALRIATDPRDWPREAEEELLDGLVYSTIGRLKP